MESDDRLVKSILAAGVLIAMGASEAAIVDDIHRGHLVKSVAEWVHELEKALFPPAARS